MLARRGHPAKEECLICGIKSSNILVVLIDVGHKFINLRLGLCVILVIVGEAYHCLFETPLFAIGR